MSNFKKSNNPNWSGGKDCVCEICGKSHYRTPARLKNAVHYYCSRECQHKGASLYPNKPVRGAYKVCPICGENFYVCQGSLNYRKYCSRKCHDKSQENHPILKCLICGKDYRTYYSQVKLRGSKYCSKKCMQIGASLKTGEKSHSWKGGISYLKKQIRKNIEWKEWRRQVFERDNWTCQICGIRSSKNEYVEIHPHHIKSYSEYPELRFNVDNGQTLCSKCHHKLHGILSKGRKRNAKTRKELSPLL